MFSVTQNEQLNMIVRFLEGASRDTCGRYLDQILAENNEYWEHTHNFIQWLFPLDEQSRSVRGSPVLVKAEVSAIRGSEVARANIQRAAERFKEFLTGTTEWRSGYDHNHLRISRVIKCLRLLVDDLEADRFKYWVAGQLGDQIDSITAESKKYWRLS